MTIANPLTTSGVASTQMLFCFFSRRVSQRQNMDSAISVPKHLLSRLLYPNPVCVLTARDAATGHRNAMVISWLTAVDNHGRFVCSVNEGRFTAALLGLHKGSVNVGEHPSPSVTAGGRDGTGGGVEANMPHFVLNPITLGMQERAIAIGSCTGAEVDKFVRFGLRACRPGWEPAAVAEHIKEGQKDGGGAEGSSRSAASTTTRPLSRRDKQAPSRRPLSQKAERAATVAAAKDSAVALTDDVAAHILCAVHAVQRTPGHLLCSCDIMAAWVRPQYWCVLPRACMHAACMSAWSMIMVIGRSL